MTNYRFINIYITAVCIILSIFNANANLTANEIMQSASKKHLSAKGISANYTVISENSQKETGIIKVQKEKFNITNPTVTIWYDGKTEWDYNINNNEVTVTNPSAEDISMINPYYLLSNYNNLFTSTLNKSKIAGTHCISLIPKSKNSSIQKAILYLRNKDLQPVRIDLTLDNKQTLTIVITNYKSNQNFNNSTFTFSKEKYPNVEIIDLR